MAFREHHLHRPSIRTYQTNISNTLATHLLSNEFPDSNVVFSPLSIYAILSVAASGSNGETLDQFLAFLKANSIDELNSLSFQHLSSLLADGSSMGGPRLSFANGVWVEKTLSLKPSFQQVLDSIHKATCKQVDFKTKAVEVVDEVNAWADKHTNGLIKQILGVDSVNSFTRLIFANALYFKGTWWKKFDQSNTKESDFHLLNGNKIQVPFLTSKSDQFVSEYDNFKVLGLSYLSGQDYNRDFTMYFFLPHAKDGLRSLLEKVSSTPDFFDNHIPHQDVHVGKFLIPKFKFSFGFEASNMLKKLGLVLPFSVGDRFPEMIDSSDDEGLYNISGVYHKSFVEVNEKGTEAAAVSAMMFAGCCMPKPKKTLDFVADHPFLFVIREDVTGAVFFIGQVINPLMG